MLLSLSKLYCAYSAFEGFEKTFKKKETLKMLSRIFLKVKIFIEKI